MIKAIAEPNKYKTKFGTAKLRQDGYWEIVSVKEGNFQKLLHRLIFEDFYQIKLPKEWIIHHDDGNKSNNEIWNLVPMTQSEHRALHNHKNNPIHQVKKDMDYYLNLSKSHNNITGLFRVSIHNDTSYKQGFTYCYQVYDNGKRVYIRSVDINKLKQKVLDRGFDWVVMDEEKAKECGLEL